MSAAERGAPLLRVEGLSAGYGEMLALRDVSLEVRRAEIVALVGSNGAGKTTLLRALSRVVASSGTVEFAGRSLTELTSDEVFGLGLVQVPEGRQLFDRMYAIFPVLQERTGQLAGSMSGGEQQMCAVARALMAAPRLIMVDEMSLGLAPVVAQQLMEVLGTIRDEGVTVLLVEQDVQLALSSSDRAYVLETGQVVLAGSADALIGDPAVQQAYLGL